MHKKNQIHYIILGLLVSSYWTIPREGCLQKLTLGARSFSLAAPKLWNGLTVELCQATLLNTLKSRLKTYLFMKYFYSV